jgi:hypothetical protein
MRGELLHEDRGRFLPENFFQPSIQDVPIAEL